MGMTPIYLVPGASAGMFRPIDFAGLLPET
jgi:hypothetical protein